MTSPISTRTLPSLDQRSSGSSWTWNQQELTQSDDSSPGWLDARLLAPKRLKTASEPKGFDSPASALTRAKAKSQEDRLPPFPDFQPTQLLENAVVAGFGVRVANPRQEADLWSRIFQNAPFW